MAAVVFCKLLTLNMLWDSICSRDAFFIHIARRRTTCFMQGIYYSCSKFTKSTKMLWSDHYENAHVAFWHGSNILSYIYWSLFSSSGRQFAVGTSSQSLAERLAEKEVRKERIKFVCGFWRHLIHIYTQLTCCCHSPLLLRCKSDTDATSPSLIRGGWKMDMLRTILPTWPIRDCRSFSPFPWWQTVAASIGRISFVQMLIWGLYILC